MSLAGRSWTGGTPPLPTPREGRSRRVLLSGVFHHGGGVDGADDSLLQFKLRFDEGGLLELTVGKGIHDEQAYRALVGEGFDG
jgi:hypothetical protein